jgi:hypothetical protein
MRKKNGDPPEPPDQWREKNSRAFALTTV